MSKLGLPCIPIALFMNKNQFGQVIFCLPYLPFQLVWTFRNCSLLLNAYFPGFVKPSSAQTGTGADIYLIKYLLDFIYQQKVLMARWTATNTARLKAFWPFQDNLPSLATPSKGAFKYHISRFYQILERKFQRKKVRTFLLDSLAQPSLCCRVCCCQLLCLLCSRCC